jgi:hypothetical protein
VQSFTNCRQRCRGTSVGGRSAFSRDASYLAPPAVAGMTNAFVEQNAGSVFFKTRMKNESSSDAGSTLVANLPCSLPLSRLCSQKRVKTAADQQEIDRVPPRSLRGIMQGSDCPQG